MNIVKVFVQNDHLERLTRVRKPILGLAELIWNALDAEAKEVRVQLELNPLGGIDRIRVSDDGHGIEHAEALSVFGKLGGSWKMHKTHTKSNLRLLHGRGGKGRFRAFALGTNIQWQTRYAQGGNLYGFRIRGNVLDLGTFEVEDPQLVDGGGPGTEVVIDGVEKNFPSLIGDAPLQEIAEYFALYLRACPDARIVYDRNAVDPSSVQEATWDYPMESIKSAEGTRIDAALTVVEWKIQGPRSLYLCDSEGFTFDETRPGIHAPGFNFTAYLKSDFIRALWQDSIPVLEDMHPDLGRLLEAGREALRDHFRRRSGERASALIEEWKNDHTYPYVGEPKGIIEQTERRVFEIVALNVHTHLPDFDKAGPQNKRLTLRLLKHALQQSPTALHRILSEVLELPQEQIEDLAQLLERTTLSAIISASKVVADRLDFLKGLECLLFNASTRDQMLERSQLHRILENYTWIFGEEFNLTVSDQSLTEVLNRHLRLLGRTAEVAGPVLREDGKAGFVDLMLSRRVPCTKPEEREHLVVELKRPSQPVDPKVASQIKDYAFAVQQDERFRDTDTTWTFLAISNDIAESVRKEASQRNRPRGLLYDDDEGRVFVWVKTWGQLLEGCRGRLQFFEKHLEYCADEKSGLSLLSRLYSKYLPESAKEARE